MGRADEAQAQALVESAVGFVEHCENYLTSKGYL